jgi:hypothetical protein
MALSVYAKTILQKLVPEVNKGSVYTTHFGHENSTKTEKLVSYKIFVSWGEAESIWISSHQWVYYIYSGL